MPSRCAEVGHDGDGCQATAKCTNCKGEHTAFSRTCPTWLLEKEVQAIKTKERISYPEARKLVATRTPRSGLSYAAALKSYSTIATQTDLPNLQKNISPKINHNVSDEPNSRKKSDIQDPNSKVHDGRKKAVAAKSVTTSPTKSSKPPPVEKSSPLSVESVFHQKPLNRPLSSAFRKVQGSVKSRKTKKSTTHDLPSVDNSRHKVSKFEKKKLKNLLKQCGEDPPLKLYTSDNEAEEMDEELEVALSSPPSFAGDTGCENAQVSA